MERRLGARMVTLVSVVEAASAQGSSIVAGSKSWSHSQMHSIIVKCWINVKRVVTWIIDKCIAVKERIVKRITEIKK